MEKQWKYDKSIGNIFENTVNRHPEKDCIVEAESGRKISFKELNELANKFGNYFNEKLTIDDNFQNNSSDTIGILLENCIEFVAIWLGLSKIGVITSWINTQLRGHSLSHSINIVNCKAIITSKLHVEGNFINFGNWKLHKLNYVEANLDIRYSLELTNCIKNKVNCLNYRKKAKNLT
uniref:Long-chain-fatty-acid--CoA ligase n=1 Tax=Meloidogyne enterolobii TaxID=390850 RepID=A0A6V7UYI7_MELEN|nr:unnamed protein product [Meloidogyne enterolobii]